MTALAALVTISLLVALIAVVFSDRLRGVKLGGVSFELEAQREFDEVLQEVLSSDETPVRLTRLEAPVASQSVNRELALMRKYHIQGLAQSRFSFFLSLVFAVLGFVGIGFALISTDTSKPIEAQSLPFASLASATLIEAVSALFFVQSNRAQRVMVDFFDKLRVDRRLEEALALAERMPDETIKARMMLVLGLGLADRPITDDLVRDTMGLSTPPIPLDGSRADSAQETTARDS